jgi:catechol 2,3-dioxygenase-like lactoylglutathione lyase family enzyme
MTTLAIRAVVPMIHVADVERSIEFYRLLGFDVGNRVPPAGPMHWAWLYAPGGDDWKRGPNLMLTRSEGVINSEAQEVLFYLYATDLVSVRNKMLENGIKAGEIAYPEYLPKGEFEVQDPDGYCLMIAQAGENTP